MTESFTAKQAIDRAWHLLTRVYGKKMMLDSEALKRDPRNVRGSNETVVSSEDKLKLRDLVQLLYDADPGGFGNTDTFKMIESASIAAGNEPALKI